MPVIATQPSDASEDLRRIFLDASAHPFVFFRIFEFLPWEQRARLTLGICRSLRDFLEPGDNHGQYWQWMCRRFAEEHQLHLPADIDKARAVAGLASQGAFALAPSFHRLCPRSRRRARDLAADGALPRAAGGCR
eukprot:CAMPEP_0176150962 /NCGR_PEP_ID=MMETSP0120_2-20121206/77092_1 /TAXON_ID=160619 /ORGANISM="Kryptoperidinium foliaceum, Strain CCMP 1326" /LENGTH=134 /DNA_ID=CAMNT_0017487917 /DNA_START=48 /DNA_END=449 /DNA_ORIENTATION=+